MPTLPAQPFYQDGDYTTPVLVWTSPKRYPLAAEGDVTTYEYTRRYLVAWAAYVPTQPGTVDPLDSTAFLVEETPPQGSRTPLAEIERIYCRVPAQLITASSQFLTPPAPPVSSSAAYRSLYFLITNGNTEVYYMSACTDAGLGAAPTGGTFTLTLNGQTTSALAYNATTSTIQTALRALSSATNWGTGLTVTGDALSLVLGPVVNLSSNFKITPSYVQNGNTVSTVSMQSGSIFSESGFLKININLNAIPLGGTSTFSFMGETSSPIPIYAPDTLVIESIRSLPKLNSNGNVSVKISRSSIMGHIIYMDTPPSFTSTPAGVVLTLDKQTNMYYFYASGTPISIGDTFTYNAYGTEKLKVIPLCRYKLKPYSLGFGGSGTTYALDLTRTVTYKIYDETLSLISTLVNPEGYEFEIPGNGAFVDISETFTLNSFPLSGGIDRIIFFEYQARTSGQENMIISGGNTSYFSSLEIKIPTTLSLTSSLTGPSSPYSGKITYHNFSIFGAKVTLSVGGRILTTTAPHRGKANSRIIAKVSSTYTEGDTYDIDSETVISAPTTYAPFNNASTITEVGSLQMSFGGAIRFKATEETQFYLTGPDPSATTVAQIQPSTQALTWFRFYNALNNGLSELVLDETDVQRWKGPIYTKKLTKISLEGLA